MRGRARAEAGGKLASTQIRTCVHTCAVAERRRSGSKNGSARNGSNTQFAASTSKPRAPNHHCPQEMADPLPASAPRPLRVRSASAPRMCEHTRGSGAGMSKSARLRSVTAPRMCERSLWYLTSTYMMTSQHGKAFWITGLLWGESTGHLWISLTKDQKYRRFKLYALKSAQTIVEQPVELPVIWHFCDITIRRDPNILWNTKRGQVCY